MTRAVRHAKKRFGQHFLEPTWVEKVIRAIDPKSDETFIEIGPGHGALTRPLAARVGTLVAFEIDRDLAAGLKRTVPSNVRVIQGDFLERSIGFSTVADELRLNTNAIATLRAAGNLPYNVASPILFKLVEWAGLAGRHSDGMSLLDATVMLQREVANRLIAGPGSKEYGVLSVLIQHSADVERLLTLPPGAFRPAPKVQSALVRLRFHPASPPVKDADVFEKLVQTVFTRRRKTLVNALLAYPATQWGPGGDGGGTGTSASPAAVLAAADIDGSRRPETLTVVEFARLADVISNNA